MYVKDKNSFVYVSENNENAIPLVQQMNHSNGIVAYVDKSKLPPKFQNKIEKAGKISINPDQPLCYYQPKEFIGNSVIIIDTSNLTKNQALYIVSEITRLRQGSTWNDKFPKEEVKKASISLPQTADSNNKSHAELVSASKNKDYDIRQNDEKADISKIDFDFMESFIRELAAYLTVSGLADATLTASDEAALQAFDSLEWREFYVTDVFNVKNTHNILSSEVKAYSGSVPYLCASAENNGVNSYISYDTNLLENGNCIFIGGKTFVVSYQKDDFFSNDSHNLALYLKNIESDRFNQLYLATCVRKSLAHKYSWGNSISNAKIKGDKVMLPACDGLPDYTVMQDFISAVQKLVIRDVVDYADSKIAATKSMVGK